MKGAAALPVVPEMGSGSKRVSGVFMKKKPLPSILTSLGALGGMGFTIAVPIVLFAIGGRYLDGLLHTGSLFLLIGLLLGLISGIYGAYRLYRSVFG
ncbi:MAG: AtpZ/AtpI family protein [Ktedonobacteraceae bacterium]|nr:AtpZ/AtpI family protein [Ktedonobacteraceae bacterium]